MLIHIVDAQGKLKNNIYIYILFYGSHPEFQHCKNKVKLMSVTEECDGLKV